MPSLTVDGRRIAYEVTGDPSNPLVVSIHGTPGGRLTSHASLPDAVSRLGCCLVTFDRPGYGESDAQPGRSVADVASIVAALTSALKAETFSVYGTSGGGPHALACAALLTDRVTRVASLAGIAPFAALGAVWTMGMTDSNVAEFAAAVAGRETITAMLTPATDMIRANPQALADLLREEVPPADVAYLDDPDRRDHLVRNIAAGVQPGANGWIDDDLAFVAPWGFDPSTITAPTLIWQGAEDRLVPVSHARWLFDAIADSRLVIMPGLGHLGAFDVQDAVLNWLITGTAPPGTETLGADPA